jgi:hypothetical protein
VQQIFFQAKHIERRDHSPLISIYSKDWKSSRFQSKAIKTNQEEEGREQKSLVKTVTRPSVKETANRSKINPTKTSFFKGGSVEERLHKRTSLYSKFEFSFSVTLCLPLKELFFSVFQ